MNRKPKEARIANIIQNHVRYRDSWAKEDGLCTTYISPKGKRCSYSGYQSDLDKHKLKAVRKIMAIAYEETTLVI